MASLKSAKGDIGGPVTMGLLARPEGGIVTVEWRTGTVDWFSRLYQSNSAIGCVFDVALKLDDAGTCSLTKV